MKRTVGIYIVKFHFKLLTVHLKQSQQCMYVTVVLPGVIDLTYDEFLNIKPFSENMTIARSMSPVNWINILNLHYIIDHEGVNDIT
jgi:hypothetical protein